MADETRRIPIIVREKVAKLVNSDETPLVCGNNDYVVEFDFDDAWANYPAKTALFVFANESVPVVFEGNKCKGVAVKNATECAIGVFAGDIRTTTGAYMPCVLSITDIGKTPKAPAKDVYDQIMDLLQKAIQAHTELPTGGKKGQVLKKRSDEDYDTAWEDDKAGSVVDLSNYYNKQEIDDKIDGINKDITTIADNAANIFDNLEDVSMVANENSFRIGDLERAINGVDEILASVAEGGAF